MEMPDINSMKPNSAPYLRKEDVPQPRLLTIKAGSFEKKRFGKDDDVEYKWIMGFEEIDETLVLNVDKLDTMAEIFNSTNTDNWEGKKIVVYVDPNVKFGGKKVGGLRVRAPKNQPPAPARKSIEDVNKDIGGIEEMQDETPW
jgi:hypothetical protein